MAEFFPRALEAGCGTGRDLPERLRSGMRVYAVDMDFDAVSTARDLLAEENVGPVFFSTARLENLPFRNGSFDAVHCVDVLHWASGIPAFEAMWKECWRVLRAGGIFSATLRAQSGWFHPEPALLDALSAGGEWLQRSETEIELRKLEPR